MNNELFVTLYDSLMRRTAFDAKDATAMRSVRIIPKALGHKSVPAILCEVVAKGSAMYDVYYPLDDASYREGLPRCGILRFNQTNIFNNQHDNRMKRQFTCGLDRRDGVCCIYGSMTLSTPPEVEQEALDRLYYFTDIFASCLGVRLLPVNLEWYKPELPANGGKQAYEK